MALKLIESFDGVSTFDQFVNKQYTGVIANGGKWVATTGAGLTTYTLDASGHTGQCLRYAVSSPSWVRTPNLGLGTECYVGFHFKPGSLTSAEGIFALYDEDSTRILYMSRNSSGGLTVVGGNAGATTLITTANSILSLSVWSYLEMRFVLHDTTGIVEVRQDGVVVGRFDGDTKAATATSIEYIGIGRVINLSGATVDDRWDNLYIADTSGSTNNGYFGVTTVQCIRPTGNGNSSQYVGSDNDSTDNYALVDEQNVNDADYVASSADGDKDTYAYGNTTTIGGHIVRGVQIVTRAANLTVGKDLAHVARLSGGTEADSADITMDASLKDRFTIWETKPGGGSWSFSDIDGAEFGQKQRP
jgi:hypothetical protein